MNTPTAAPACESVVPPVAGGDERQRWLQHIVEEAAHWLPAQGPITVFIHHNTLHSLEDERFETAVVSGQRTYGCQPFLAERHYREAVARNRILPEDLAAVLIQDLGERAADLLGFLGTRFALRKAMLEHPLWLGPEVELQWLVMETDALCRLRREAPDSVVQRALSETQRWVMRDLLNGNVADPELRRLLAGVFQTFDQSRIEHWGGADWESFYLHLLWQLSLRGVASVALHERHRPEPVRPRDLLLDAAGEDPDQLVHELLIRFCAAFLDQGFADWPLPGRHLGFFLAFLDLYRGCRPVSAWLQRLPAEATRLWQAHCSPWQAVDEYLQRLGVPDAQAPAFITQTLLALRGWAGMVWQMETNAEWAEHPAPAGSLAEFLAVRLMLDTLAAEHVARDVLGQTGALATWRASLPSRAGRKPGLSHHQLAFLVLQLAQLLGWKPEEIYRLAPHEWSLLVAELEEFSELERRRIFHLAYERRYRLQTLDAIACHAGRSTGPGKQALPAFQVICCLDEREESFRRHLEEIDPACETYGGVGFFGVAMYYQGAADAHYKPLCPVVIKPRHFVREEVVYPQALAHRRRADRRRAWGVLSHHVHRGSRTFVGGAVTGVLGSVASIPLTACILFPRLTARMRSRVGRMVETPLATQLQLERTAADPGPAADQIGFSLDEMCDIVERFLRDIGLTSRLARVVIVMGHGSSSLNNPHEAAHDCGACGGGRGGPNARAFAWMANDPRVRAVLADRGLSLPDGAVFVGAYHNTCDDSVTYYDLERLSSGHVADFERARSAIDQARERNAHERCRRFESAPLQLTAKAALRHVEERAEDLSQTRPEYGHATNAICLVGRREVTRGLFLDRRAFLVSYDPAQDDARRSILTRILLAAVPVCAGISLEYYFSYVDPLGYGCGTKLPHNVTALLGVMDGAASDLRPGLPWQMVEIHEPVRLLFIVEAPATDLQRIIAENAVLDRLCRGEWIQMASLDPASRQLHLWQDGRPVPYRPETARLPTADSSRAWYRGWRDHLGYAQIVGDAPPEGGLTNRFDASPRRSR